MVHIKVRNAMSFVATVDKTGVCEVCDFGEQWSRHL